MDNKKIEKIKEELHKKFLEKLAAQYSNDLEDLLKLKLEYEIIKKKLEIAQLEDQLIFLLPKTKVQKQAKIEFVLKICLIAGCDEKVHAKDLCKKHYDAARLRVFGKCSTEGCNNKGFRAGMCKKHRKEFLANG